MTLHPDRESDIILAMQTRRREATHDFKGVQAWLQSEAALLKRDGFKCSAEVMAARLEQQALNVSVAIDHLHKP